MYTSSSDGCCCFTLLVVFLGSLLKNRNVNTGYAIFPRVWLYSALAVLATLAPVSFLLLSPGESRSDWQ